jgi:hypothetical protein
MPFIQSGGQVIVTVPAGQRILVTSYGAGQTKIAIGTKPSQFPEAFIDTTVIENGSWLSSTFSTEQSVEIDAAVCEVEYVIAVSPVATKERYQPGSVAITGGTINNVPIGQTTPAAGSFTNLVASNSFLRGKTTDANYGIDNFGTTTLGIVRTASTAGGAFYFSNSLDGATVGAFGEVNAIVGGGVTNDALVYTTGNLRFAAGTSERARIDSSGNFGIGTSAPGARLEVNGGNSNTEIRFNHADNSTGRTVTLRMSSSSDPLYVGAGAYVRAIQGSGVDVYSLAFGTTQSSTSAVERSRITSVGNQIDFQPSESAQNTSATLTIAQLQSQIITSNAAVTLTLPTPAALEGYTLSMAANTAFEVTFIATTANAITIAANGNNTVGNLTVDGNTSGVFRFRKTGTNTFTVYRIA